MRSTRSWYDRALRISLRTTFSNPSETPGAEMIAEDAEADAEEPVAEDEIVPEEEMAVEEEAGEAEE